MWRLWLQQKLSTGNHLIGQVFFKKLNYSPQKNLHFRHAFILFLYCICFTVILSYRFFLYFFFPYLLWKFSELLCTTPGVCKIKSIDLESKSWTPFNSYRRNNSSKKMLLIIIGYYVTYSNYNRTEIFKNIRELYEPRQNSNML